MVIIWHGTMHGIAGIDHSTSMTDGNIMDREDLSQQRLRIRDLTPVTFS